MAKKDGKNTDRERIPERVVHARGFVCYGEFEATGHIGMRSATVGA